MIEDLIKESKSKGLRFNNLFELPNNAWQCNLHHVLGNWYDFGEGKTPEEAIRNAINRTEKNCGVKESIEDLL